MNKMDYDNKIFVAGAAGMVGSAIVRNLVNAGYHNIIGSFHSQRPGPETFLFSETMEKMPTNLKLVRLDLTNQNEVNHFFADERPEYVFLAAARVGGIHANNTFPAQFIYENMAIQSNVIHAAYLNDVERLLFLGSSCIYPRITPQPMKEEYLLSGQLEPTNEPYAIAKISGIKMCESYNRQYGTQFISIMPTNLYGPNDNFDLENSHVLPALLRKFHEAKESGSENVSIWGTGNSRREFMHVEDMASASVFMMNLKDFKVKKWLLDYPNPCFVNIGTGNDCTIRELAHLIKNVVGFNGEFLFDTTKPDGTPQKLLDVGRIHKLGWRHRISLETGVHKVYKWYLNQLSH